VRTIGAAELLGPGLESLGLEFEETPGLLGHHPPDQGAEHTALFDVERGKLDGLRLTPWQTDTSVSINSWGYAQDDHYQETEMHRIDAHLGGVRWAGSFDVDRQGRWEYTVQAWTDVFGTWRDELSRKVAAQQHDLAGELSEGVRLLQTASEAAKANSDKALIDHAIATLSDEDVPEAAGGNQPSPGSFALQDSVGAYGSAVQDLGNVGGRDR